MHANEDGGLLCLNLSGCAKAYYKYSALLFVLELHIGDREIKLLQTKAPNVSAYRLIVTVPHVVVDSMCCE